jgi:hypothetical protein
MATDSIVTGKIDQHDELVEEQLEANNEEGQIEEVLDLRAAKLAEISENRKEGCVAKSQFNLKTLILRRDYATSFKH